MGKSSKDKRDAYYRLAKEQGWRARSAFKLLQLDEEFNLFENVTRVVDLCAAPGSWSQVLSRESTPAPREQVKIVSIDLQPISPLPGIITLRADITHPATVPLLLKALDPDFDPSTMNPQASHPVDLVISDGAPDVTGLHDLDIYVQSQLLFAALNLALCVLKPGGKFVAKIFRGRNVDLLYAQLKVFFEKPPEGFTANLEEPLGVGNKLAEMLAEKQAKEEPTTKSATQTPADKDGIYDVEVEDLTNEPLKDIRWVAPFVACGDLSAFDSDASYKLPDDHVSLDPVQPPTAPPYKRAIELRRQNGGAYKKTGPATAKA
uniref:Probable tRNA 2'-O-ribose methyltransferase n=1 Tax=Neurospora crassa TaxID=5141 RepID=Q6MFI8_NEUCS|nr:probable tRNA 2'-O-ribose methyltransferase [Neurospora crassa]